MDTLKPNPEFCKNVLAKSGSKSVLGKAAGGGKIGSERKVRTPMTEEQKARRKEIIKMAKVKMADKSFQLPGIGVEAKMSNRGIKEWTNQPFENMAEKDEQLLDLQNLLNKSTYEGFGPDKRDKSKKTYYFSCKIGGSPAYIIVREGNNPNELWIHSISDHSMLKYITNKP